METATTDDQQKGRDCSDRLNFLPPGQSHEIKQEGHPPHSFSVMKHCCFSLAFCFFLLQGTQHLGKDAATRRSGGIPVLIREESKANQCVYSTPACVHTKHSLQSLKAKSTGEHCFSALEHMKDLYDI